jgi:hypothetical protein
MFAVYEIGVEIAPLPLLLFFDTLVEALRPLAYRLRITGLSQVKCRLGSPSTFVFKKHVEMLVLDKMNVQ